MIQEKMESIVLGTVEARAYRPPNAVDKPLVEAFGAITEVNEGLLHCNQDCKCGMWYNLITEF